LLPHRRATSSSLLVTRPLVRTREADQADRSLAQSELFKFNKAAAAEVAIADESYTYVSTCAQLMADQAAAQRLLPATAAADQDRTMDVTVGASARLSSLCTCVTSATLSVVSRALLA
jgi:GTP cyclohydrolase FolE2